MSRIPTFVVLVLVLSSLVPAHGQLSSLYGFGQAMGTYTAITGGTVLVDTTFDDVVFEQPVPPFFFNGSYHSTVFVSSNGFLTLGTAPVATNYTPLSNAAAYTGAISPFGANLINSGVGTPEIRYEQVGPELVFQWQDVKRFAMGTERFSFQARVNTTTGVIRFVYSSVSGLSTVTTHQSETGLRGPTNAFSNVKNRRVTTGADTWATSLAGTSMSSKMRFTATAPAKSPVGGETYTFTPACLSPVATTTITSDCSINSFMVAVSITGLGSGPSVDILANTAGVLHQGVGIGTYLCGPFTLGTPVTLSAVNTANAGCTNVLGDFSPATTCDTIDNGTCLPEPYPLIPDNGCDNGADLQVTIPIAGLNPELGSGPGQTFFQSLEFIVAHTYRGDLRIRLTSPSGQTRDLLIQQPGPQAEGSNFGNPNACPGIVVQLRDDAPQPITAISPDAPNVTGAFQPEEPLSGFTGAANGNWILRICDASPEDAGSLRYIRLRLRSVDCLGVIGGTTVPGSPCDDGDPQTTDDVYGSDCTCAGTGTSGVEVDARVLLEGCYDPGAGLMHDSLRAQGLVPLTEPYTSAGYVAVGGGGETTLPAVLAVQGPVAVVDWVILELRDANDASVISASRCALLRRDGHIVEVDGTSPVSFTGSPEGPYTVVVRHRNHLGVATATAVDLSVDPLVDLINGPTFGTGATKNVGGQNVLWAGDTFMDGVLRYVGSDNDRDPILLRVGGTMPNSSLSGYYPEDVNMDGRVRYIGAGNDRDPVLVNVGNLVPNSVRAEQLP